VFGVEQFHNQQQWLLFLTLSRPTEVQMLVALVEKAVEKFERGPTSTTA
jgi:lipid A disaccharide synthetase